MPTIIAPLITDAGLAAAIAASGSGLQLAITHVALGSGQYTPANNQTALTNRKEKVTVASGVVGATGSFKLSVLFGAWAGVPNPYNATEVGFYAGDPDAGGVLFAVYSHPSAVIVQRNALDYVAQFGLQLSRVPAGSVTVTIDPAGSVALSLIAAHEGAADPHVVYASRAQANNLMTAAGVASDFATATKITQAVKRLSGANITLVNAANSPYTLTADNAGLVQMDGTAGNIVANLPAANAVAAKIQFRFVRIDAAVNTATVNRAGADTFIGGATSITLSGQGDFRAVESDAATKWNTTAVAAAQGVKAGTILPFAGATPPAGTLACPITATNVSRTTYATLFAAIGITWGAGDGSTTFGLPSFPADYTLSQANGNIGGTTVGALITHAHGSTTGNGFWVDAPGLYAVNAGGSTLSMNEITTTAATGGAANLAAGRRVQLCIQY